MTRRDRGQLLYEAKVRMKKDGNGRKAWKMLSESAKRIGYHANWAWMMADYLKIPPSDRK